jgi:RNA polymerase sigma-B factor
VQATARRITAAEEIERLPEREILYLRFFEGKTQSEIAAVIGISQMHVSRLLRRRLDELRAGIEGDDG